MKDKNKCNKKLIINIFIFIFLFVMTLSCNYETKEELLGKNSFAKKNKKEPKYLAIKDKKDYEIIGIYTDSNQVNIHSVYTSLSIDETSSIFYNHDRARSNFSTMRFFFYDKRKCTPSTKALKENKIFNNCFIGGLEFNRKDGGTTWQINKETNKVEVIKGITYNGIENDSPIMKIAISRLKKQVAHMDEGTLDTGYVEMNAIDSSIVFITKNGNETKMFEVFNPHDMPTYPSRNIFIDHFYDKIKEDLYKKGRLKVVLRYDIIEKKEDKEWILIKCVYD